LKPSLDDWGNSTPNSIFAQPHQILQRWISKDRPIHEVLLYPQPILANKQSQTGLFTMRGRRPGESLFHWDIAPSLWFRQVTHDVKLTNLQNLPPRPENR
jgi:hypothetical protein